jgi:hypothetical protein
MNSGAKIADGDVHTVLQDQEVIKAYLGDSEDWCFETTSNDRVS